MKYTFDSFKIRLPLEDVEVKNELLLSTKVRITTDKDTGVIIDEEELQSKSFKADFDHYQIHFGITDSFGVPELVILVNSKLLQERYLEGITPNNIEVVYNRLMSVNVVYMDFETFLHGYVTDLDIKQDTVIESVELFDECTREMERKSKPKKRTGHGVNRVYQHNNKGIEWNKRATATPTNPFLKIYHKGIESRNGNNQSFFQYYAVPILANLVRIESTIKNKKHFNALGIESNKLKDLLNVNNEVYQTAVENALQRNLEPRNIKPQTPRNSKPMTIQENLIFTFMSACVTSMKMTKEETVQFAISNFNDKLRKHRAKKKVLEIYEQYIEGETYQQKIEKEVNFFRIIGWG